MIAHDDLIAPILVIDFGTSTSSAVLLADGRERLLKEPSTGSASWPSSVHVENGTTLVGTPAERRKRRNPSAYRTEFKRDLGQSLTITIDGRPHRPEELVTAVLRAFREAAHVVAGRPVDRLLVTVPASYGDTDPRRTAMLIAGGESGFTDVELLAEPVAAASAPVAGQPWHRGDVVLVYDFGGGTFDTALVRIDEHGGEVLGHAALDDCGGRDVDAAIAGKVRADSRDWLGPLMDRDEVTAFRLRLDLVDLVRRLKHQLGETELAEDYLQADSPLSSLTVADLRVLARPLLDRTIVRCRALLDDAGVDLAEVTGVLLVGGSTRMPVVGETLARELRLPLRRAEDPELAVVYGAARWAEGVGRRRAVPRARERGVEPLRWAVPGDVATLTRWLVQPGESYPAGTALARVRLADGALYDLLADVAGTVVGHHIVAGKRLLSDDWPVTTRLPAEPEDLLDSPSCVLQRSGAVAALAVSPDGRQVAVCGDGVLDVLLLPNGREVYRHDYLGRIHSLDWTPDGSRLGYGRNADTHELSVLAAGTWTEQAKVTYPAAVHDIAFGARGRQVAVGCGDGLIRVHDLVRRTEVFAADLPDWVDTVTMHPRGRLVAAGSRHEDAGAVGVWDLAGGPERPQLALPSPVRALEYSPDGQLLAIGGGDVVLDGFVILLDAGTMQTRHDLAAQWRHGASVRAVAFSPNSRMLAVGGENGIVQMWDTASGEALPAITTASNLTGLAFAPDGDRLLVGTDTEMTVWALTERGLARDQEKEGHE